MSGQVCLSRIRRARASAPAAIQVVLPDWLPLSPMEVERALERMLQEADGVPVVLYNPPHAKTVCSPEQLAALAEAFPGMVGVKVAGDDAFYSRLHAAAPQLVYLRSRSRACPRSTSGCCRFVFQCRLPDAGWRAGLGEADGPRTRTARRRSARELWPFLSLYCSPKGRGLLQYRAGQGLGRHRRVGTDRHPGPLALQFGTRRARSRYWRRWPGRPCPNCFDPRPTCLSHRSSSTVNIVPMRQTTPDLMTKYKGARETNS